MINLPGVAEGYSVDTDIYDDTNAGEKDNMQLQVHIQTANNTEASESIRFIDSQIRNMHALCHAF